jgi:hypothetical protein
VGQSFTPTSCAVEAFFVLHPYQEHIGDVPVARIQDGHSIVHQRDSAAYERRLRKRT